MEDILIIDSEISLITEQIINEKPILKKSNYLNIFNNKNKEDKIILDTYNKDVYLHIFGFKKLSLKEKLIKRFNINGLIHVYNIYKSNNYYNINFYISKKPIDITDFTLVNKDLDNYYIFKRITPIIDGVVSYCSDKFMESLAPYHYMSWFNILNYSFIISIKKIKK